jgi:hypothetical protein
METIPYLTSEVELPHKIRNFMNLELHLHKKYLYIFSKEYG